MSFVYPAFLFALSSIAIPIIIHFFNFRRYKKVYFSNVAFLRLIRDETRNRTRIRQWLILLMRILALAALVFAFAQPYIRQAASVDLSKQKVVAIYLDNSFSMEAEGPEGLLVDVAKNKVRSIVQAYPPSTRFILTTNDFESLHQRIADREQLLEFLADVSPSAAPASLSQVYIRQKEFFSAGNPGAKFSPDVFWISDFQKIMADFEHIPRDTMLSVRLIPLNPAAVDNLALDSCWFESPSRPINRPDSLMVKIRNHGSQSYINIPLTLYINDSVKSVSNFSIEPASELVLPLKYTNTGSGYLFGRVEINDYPITFDNALHFSYPLSSVVNILIVSDKTQNKNIQAVFEETPNFRVESVLAGQLAPSAISDYHLLILCDTRGISSGLAEVLQEYVSQGGHLVLFPGREADRESLNNFLQTVNMSGLAAPDSAEAEMTITNTSHELYRSVFKKLPEKALMPRIKYLYGTTGSLQSTEETVLQTNSGQKLLTVSGFGQGRVYLFSFPIDRRTSDFVMHPLFVTTLFNMAILCQTSGRLYYTTGRDRQIESKTFHADGQDNVPRIERTDGLIDFIPGVLPGAFGKGTRLDAGSHITQDGNYRILLGRTTVGGVSFNYDRRESEMDFYTTQEMEQLLNRHKLSNIQALPSLSDDLLTHRIVSATKGTQLWKWFIIAALCFLAAEIALIRFWKA